MVKPCFNLPATGLDFQFLFPVTDIADITAALGLCLENMSKEELDRTKDVMHSILQGVSCINLSLLVSLVRNLKASAILFLVLIVANR